MKRLQLIWVCVIAWISMVCICDEHADQIAKLRGQQWCAAYTDYVAHEDEIERIKHEHSVPQDNPWFAVSSYIHAVPWIVWQLFAVVLACICGIMIPYAWSGRYIVTTICVAVLCGIVMYVSWWGYHASTCVYGVVCTKRAPIRVGPSNKYPVIQDVPYLHEVEMRQRLEEWSKVRYTDTYGWIANADIVFINSNRYS